MKNLCCSIADPYHVSIRALSRPAAILFLIPTVSFAPMLFAADVKNIDDFQDAAAKANAVLTIPDWAQTPDAVESAMKNAIARANQRLDEIGRQDLKKVTFKSTVTALNDLAYEATSAANKAVIIKETNPNEALRNPGERAGGG